VTTMDVPPPDDLYRTVAVEQAIRWGYTKTLDGAELSAFIRRQAEDSNLRADADAVWQYAQKRKADRD
jgi:hypothetical protein